MPTYIPSKKIYICLKKIRHRPGAVHFAQTVTNRLVAARCLSERKNARPTFPVPV